MSQESVHFRIDRDEYDHLKEEARKRKMSPTALARLFLRDGLGGFDRKHDALLDRIEMLQSLLIKGNILAASALASSALPVGSSDQLPESAKEQVRNHIKESVRQGRNIDGAYDNGTFDQGGANVSSN